MISVVHNGVIKEAEEDDADVELVRPEALFGTNINLIPMQSAVQVARLFYGSRFFNQAVPLTNPQSALVQNARSDGKSFDRELGIKSGAIFADTDAEVVGVTPDNIKLKQKDGTIKDHDLYDNFKFNRKTSITQTPLVKVGDHLKKDSLIARSSFTDDSGDLAIGRNAVTAVTPYKGYSMDDAVVVSEGFAADMTSRQSYSHKQEFRNDTKGGKKHFQALFPTEFTSKQLEKLDDQGVVQIGTILEEGDPIILATEPKRLTSTTAQLGRLSKAMSQVRQSTAQAWDHKSPGVVRDVVKVGNSYHVVIDSDAALVEGDKIVLRSGQKGIVSKIIPEAKMPRTKSGQKIDVLLNPLGIPSRVNDSLIYELGLGKAAAATGEKVIQPGYTKPDENWYDKVRGIMADAGVVEKEELYDPEDDSYLEAPVTVGVGHFMKLQHMVDHKSGARGNAAYDVDEQPLKGGSDSAQAKRLSGLETSALLSSSAYSTLRESATLRGQKNDEYWRLLRQGHSPAAPDKPFVWDKFQALLTGSGMLARDVGGGKLRLGPMTDRHLDEFSPVQVDTGDLVHPRDLSPVKGGLFDERLVGANKWGYMTLPHPVPNPAFEDGIAKLLGMTHKKLTAILAGEEELPEHLQNQLTRRK